MNEEMLNAVQDFVAGVDLAIGELDVQSLVEQTLQDEFGITDENIISSCVDGVSQGLSQIREQFQQILNEVNQRQSEEQLKRMIASERRQFFRRVGGRPKGSNEWQTMEGE